MYSDRLRELYTLPLFAPLVAMLECLQARGSLKWLVRIRKISYGELVLVTSHGSTRRGFTE